VGESFIHSLSVTKFGKIEEVTRMKQILKKRGLKGVLIDSAIVRIRRRFSGPPFTDYLKEVLKTSFFAKHGIPHTSNRDLTTDYTDFAD